MKKVLQKNRKWLIWMVIILTLLSACQPNWKIPLLADGESAGTITAKDFKVYQELAEDDPSQIFLGQFLYINGFTLIEDIIFHTEYGKDLTYAWEEIAAETTITETGEISIGETLQPVTSISLTRQQEESSILMNIMDIAPTMAAALGLPPLPDTVGKVQYQTFASHGVLILLDGLQYEKLDALIQSDELAFFGSVPEIHKGLTVYPPITTAASAAFLTGTPPQTNGVFGYGFRSTDVTTLFDLAAQNRRSVVAVEGASLPFNLRSAETFLSGDHDGNGFSDDNVFENSLATIQVNMPDLMYIHFHDIDDAGHSYGPESDAYTEAIQRVDGYLSDLYTAFPAETLVILFADHGMHAESEGGTHGNLISSDLIIPIIFLKKN